MISQKVAVENDYHLATTSSWDISQVSAPMEEEQARLRREAQLLVPTGD
jgi:hypothetical protein